MSKKITLKDFFNSDKYLVIHCPKKWQSEKLLSLFDKLGKKWCNDESYLAKNNWDRYKKDTCYSNKGDFSNITYLMSNLSFSRYTIYDFDEIVLYDKQTILIPVGISGSGKSTYYENKLKDKFERISPDLIRKELTGDISCQAQNREVYNIAYKRLNECLDKMKNVYFDATNLKAKDVSRLLQEIKSFKTKCPSANLEIKFLVFDDSVNFDKCFKRIQNDLNQNKDRAVVNRDTLQRMHQKFMLIRKGLLSQGEYLTEIVSADKVLKEVTAKDLVK